MSLISVRRCCPASTMCSTQVERRALSPAITSGIARSCPKPMIALSGVRSSWLMFDRNSLFARFARSAAAVAKASSPLDTSSCKVRSRTRTSAHPSRAAAPPRARATHARPEGVRSHRSDERSMPCDPGTAAGATMISTSISVPSLIRWRQMPELKTSAGAARTDASTAGTSSGGRISRIVNARNSSREAAVLQPRATSLTSRKCKVSTS